MLTNKPEDRPTAALTVWMTLKERELCQSAAKACPEKFRSVSDWARSVLHAETQAVLAKPLAERQ